MTKTSIHQEAQDMLRIASYFPKRIALYTNLDAQRADDDENMYQLLYASYDADGNATVNSKAISSELYNELAQNCYKGQPDLEEFDDAGYWTTYKTKRVIKHLRKLEELLLAAQ